MRESVCLGTAVVSVLKSNSKRFWHRQTFRLGLCCLMQLKKSTSTWLQNVQSVGWREGAEELAVYSPLCKSEYPLALLSCFCGLSPHCCQEQPVACSVRHYIMRFNKGIPITLK